MTPHLEVFVGPAHDLVHTSLVLTGFCELARRGAISLRYRYPRAADRWLVADPMVIVFDLHGPGTIRIAIDLRDGEGISRPIVDRVKWYFKRSYSARDHELLAPGGETRLLPFGLNFPCRSLRSSVRLLRTIGGPIALTGRIGLERLRHYLATPRPSAFEQGPGTPVESWVHFQPRLWVPEEVAPGEADAVNAERVTMVRVLKKEFGARFIGGLVGTAFARQHYPNDVTPHSSKYDDYLLLKKRCVIGVYTRGLEHSLAFKLGETFAASQCLVTVPLRYELPAALEAGRHYLVFESVDGCLDACHRLLSDRPLAAAMRQANHEYYVREIEPAAHIARVLTRATSETSPSSL